MPGQAGRKCVIKKDGTTIAGGQTTSLSWNGTAIDTTDQGSGQFQEFLDAEMATDTLELSIDGMEKDGVVRTAALTATAAAKHLSDLSFEFPNGDAITGDFILTSYTSTGAHQDAQKFQATFVRNGAHTFTAAGA